MPMNLRIVCPDSCAFDGTVAFVTVPTTDGEMGIAPLHALRRTAHAHPRREALLQNPQFALRP